MERISKEQYYLDIAKAVSARSTCLRRKYGAIIVKDDAVIATGYNGSPRGDLNCCDTGACAREIQNIPKGERYELCKAVHAEQNCLIQADRSRTIGAKIYIYGFDIKIGENADPTPCLLCRRMLINAGITECIGYGRYGEIVHIDLKKLSF